MGKCAVRDWLDAWCGDNFEVLWCAGLGKVRETSKCARRERRGGAARHTGAARGRALARNRFSVALLDRVFLKISQLKCTE
jgi:hypothetical protein